MALVNHAKKEINVKLVFFGPQGSGKSTSLQFIYKKLKPDCRGQLKTLQTQGGRMMFFDFMPADLPAIEGYRARFHLYTLTGEPLDSPTWKMVMKGVDGVMFVAVSSFGDMEANLSGVTQLRAFLADNDRDLLDIPFVLQCNKQDLPQVSPAPDIASALGLEGGQAVATNALTGEGVLQGLSEFVKSVMRKLRETGPGMPPVEPEESPEDANPVESTSSDAPLLAGYPSHVTEAPVDEAEDFGEVGALEGASVRVFEPVVAAGDVIKIPLSVTCADGEKQVTISLKITVDR